LRGYLGVGRGKEVERIVLEIRILGSIKVERIGKRLKIKLGVSIDLPENID